MDGQHSTLCDGKSEATRQLPLEAPRSKGKKVRWRNVAVLACGILVMVIYCAVATLIFKKFIQGDLTHWESPEAQNQVAQNQLATARTRPLDTNVDSGRAGIVQSVLQESPQSEAVVDSVQSKSELNIEAERTQKASVETDEHVHETDDFAVAEEEEENEEEEEEEEEKEEEEEEEEEASGIYWQWNLPRMDSSSFDLSKLATKAAKAVEKHAADIHIHGVANPLAEKRRVVNPVLSEPREDISDFSKAFFPGAHHNFDIGALRGTSAVLRPEIKALQDMVAISAAAPIVITETEDTTAAEADADEKSSSQQANAAKVASDKAATGAAAAEESKEEHTAKATADKAAIETVAAEMLASTAATSADDFKPGEATPVVGHAPGVNFLYLVADDLRPELSVYGRGAKTPNLEGLARRGVVFDRAYAQMTVCCPSRASFMTGRKPDVTKIWHFENIGNADFTSIPQLFAGNGYLALGFGKLWHRPEGPGGDKMQWRDNEKVTGHRFFPRDEFQPIIQRERKLQNATVTPVDFGVNRHFGPGDEFMDVQFADRAVHAIRELAMLRNATSSKGTAHTRPFFLGVGFSKPHEPYVYPAEYWDLYANLDGQHVDSVEGQETATVNQASSTGTLRSASALPLAPWPLSPHMAPPFARGDVQPGFQLRFGGAQGTAEERAWADNYYCQGDEEAADWDVAVAKAEKARETSPQHELWAPLEAMKTFSCTTKSINHQMRRFMFGDYRSLSGITTSSTTIARQPMPRPVRRELLRGYLGAVSFMDAQVGRLLWALEQYGLADNTVVVFHSDHGFSIGDHGQWGKRSLYENDARVPLIIADPRSSAGHGTRSSAFVELVDILPTLGHLAGLQLSDTTGAGNAQNKSMIPTAALRGPPLSGMSLVHLLDGQVECVDVYKLDHNPDDDPGVDDHASTLRPDVEHIDDDANCRIDRGRVAAVTQFARCPLSTPQEAAAKPGQAREFRTGIQSAVSWGCLSNGKKWYRDHGVAIMGYSLRTRGWRYTAWLLWKPNATEPIWRYPPFGEELYDHRTEDANIGYSHGGSFDASEGATLHGDSATAPLRWLLFLALKAIVEDDTASGNLKGGYGLGDVEERVGALAQLGLQNWNGSSDGGSGILPEDLAQRLDEFGLLPPQHFLVDTDDPMSDVISKQLQLQGVTTGGPKQIQYEAAGVGPWPAVLSRTDAHIAASEKNVRIGDIVFVASSASSVHQEKKNDASISTVAKAVREAQTKSERTSIKPTSTAIKPDKSDDDTVASIKSAAKWAVAQAEEAIAGPVHLRINDFVGNGSLETLQHSLQGRYLLENLVEETAVAMADKDPAESSQPALPHTWQRYVVRAVLPRATLSGEWGAALVLDKCAAEPCTSKVGGPARDLGFSLQDAETIIDNAALHAQDDGIRQVFPSTLVVPSRLWTEDTNSPQWLWRQAKPES